MSRCSEQNCAAPVKARGLCSVHYQRWLRGDTAITAGPSRRAQRNDQCSVPGCGTQPVAKGLCGRHYQRLQRTGDVGEAAPTYQARCLPCRVDGCTASVYARGWCVKHYENNRLRGDPLADGPGRGSRKPPDWLGGPCAVDGCTRLAEARRWCRMHYNRWQRLGDPGSAEPLLAPRGSGSINANGYREISVDGRRMLEHRHVMEQMLSRPLSGDENVHHRNGVRADNRPENLELWVSCQPPRQNVEELVAWAHAVLDQYGDDVEQLRLFHT